MSVTIISYVPTYAGGSVTSGSIVLNAPNQGVVGQLSLLFTQPDEILIGTGAQTFSVELFGDVLNGTFGSGYSYNELLPPSSALDINNQTLDNVLDPTTNQQAATKNYVDVQVGSVGGPFLSTSGGTLTGDLVMDDTSNARVLLANGSMASPSLAFAGDTDTGVWWPGLNTVEFVTAGNTRFSIDSTGSLTVPTGYESLVTADTVIPNKKYVDDEIAVAIGGAGPFLQLSGGIMFGSIVESSGGVFIGEGSGLASAPDFTFVPSTNTGMYYVAANGIGFSSLGSNIFTLESSGTLRVPAGYESLVIADTVITNKKYVDDQDALYLPLAGGTMSGALNMGGFLLSNVLAPTAASHVTDKNYVDTEISSLSSVYLALTGGTMTGDINMGGNSLVLDADLDTSISAAVDDTVTLTVGGFPATVWTGLTSTVSFQNYRAIDLLDPTGAQDAATKNYVDTTFLPLSGGTMTGNITFAGTQLFPYDNTASGLTATDLQSAVDENDSRIDALEAAGPFLPLAGGTMTGDITFAGTQLFPYDNLSSGMTATDLQAATDELDGRVDTLEASSPALPLSGGTMTGDINMGGNDITNGGTITAATLNSAGVTIGSADMQSSAGGGSFLVRTSSTPAAATPTYSFVANSNSGVYTNGSEVRVSVLGSDRVRFGTDVDVQGAKVTNAADPTVSGDLVTLGFLAGISFVRVLGTASGIDFNTAGTTTVYTVPVGKTHIITQVVVRATSVNPGATPTNPDISLGISGPNYNQILADNTTLNWPGASTAADQAVTLLPKDGAATPNASDVITLEVDTTSGFTTLVGTVYVVGFEV